MEIAIVEFFQSFACGFLDVFFWLITKLGEETMFFFVLTVAYLCYSKKFAIKISFYYLSSVAFNNLLKLIVKRPRPYVESTTISNRLNADGYSFPSGHTQGYFAVATTSFIEVNKYNKSRSIKISTLVILSLLGILVMLSRMYWGQHFLSDVVVGMMFGISVIYFMDWLITILPNKVKELFTLNRIYVGLGVVALILFIIILMLDIFAGFNVDVAYKFCGVFFAMSIGYFVDKKWIGYESCQGFKIGLLKALISVSIIALLYWALSVMFRINSYIIFVVYLFLGLICTTILPVIFKKLFKVKVDNENCRDR